MGDGVRDHRKIAAWSKGHELALWVYKETERFPKSQLYGLTSQVQRAAVSVGANIAEGCGRGGIPELSRFMRIARGSSHELSYLFLLATDLGYLSRETGPSMIDRANEVSRMLTAYIDALHSSS